MIKIFGQGNKFDFRRKITRNIRFAALLTFMLHGKSGDAVRKAAERDR
jgi:hypothetical protein